MRIVLTACVCRAGEFLAARTRDRIGPFVQRWVREMTRFDRRFDCRAAVDAIQFEPRVSARDGLAETFSVLDDQSGTG